MPKIIETICPDCKGTGKLTKKEVERIGSIEMKCMKCNGTGKIQSFEVDMPPPIRRYRGGAKTYQG